MERPVEKIDPAGVHIRWMIRRDMEEVLLIEQDSFAFPWHESDFVGYLRTRNTIGMVAHDEVDVIVAYMVYELHKTRLNLLNLAVSPEVRRQGIGSKMIDKLTGKLSHQRRTRLETMAGESNLTAQLFFRHCGFVAEGIQRQPYEVNEEDAIRFVWRLKLNKLEARKLSPWDDEE